jgi:hypothetical protein
MRWPKRTEDGQAASQPRHWMHSSMKRSNDSSSGAPPNWTAFIAAMRPRGEAVSRPVTR